MWQYIFSYNFKISNTIEFAFAVMLKEFRKLRSLRNLVLKYIKKGMEVVQNQNAYYVFASLYSAD